jgi:hypothetical protein
MVRLLAMYPALPFAVMRASVMICKFALVAFLARYLGLSSLGLYGLALGVVSILPVLAGMGMGNADHAGCRDRQPGSSNLQSSQLLALLGCDILVIAHNNLAVASADQPHGIGADRGDHAV